MPNWLQKLIVNLYRLLNTGPSTKELMDDAREIEREIERENQLKAPNDTFDHALSGKEYCCIIYWPENWKAGERTITVNSVKACERLADRHGANYVRPVLNRRCSQES